MPIRRRSISSKRYSKKGRKVTFSRRKSYVSSGKRRNRSAIRRTGGRGRGYSGALQQLKKKIQKGVSKRNFALKAIGSGIEFKRVTLRFNAKIFGQNLGVDNINNIAPQFLFNLTPYMYFPDREDGAGDVWNVNRLRTSELKIDEAAYDNQLGLWTRLRNEVFDGPTEVEYAGLYIPVKGKSVKLINRNIDLRFTSYFGSTDATLIRDIGAQNGTAVDTYYQPLVYYHCKRWVAAKKCQGEVFQDLVKWVDNPTTAELDVFYNTTLRALPTWKFELPSDKLDSMKTGNNWNLPWNYDGKVV